MDRNTQDVNKNRSNQKRSPFTKLDNKRKNLHSPDVDRDEIANGDPNRDLLEKRRLEEGTPGKSSNQ